MKSKNDREKYILLPLSIYEKFFKDIKISGKKISAVLDETENRRNKRKASRITEQKSKKQKHSSSESENGQAESEFDSANSSQSTDSE